MATLHKKSVLITGCSTGGIGWAMAKVFHARGFHVFATARNPSRVSELAELANVEVLLLDVTDLDTITRCKDTVAKRTGGTLDILINNAGTEFVCPLLDVDIAEAKKLYDINVWGLLSVVQVFAPLVIEAKGLISNHTSVAAFLPMCWAGIYASSKAAEVRISEVLRVELKPLGVRVVTTYCGSVQTPIFDKAGGKMQLPETSHYFNVTDTAYKQRMDHAKESMQVDAFVEYLVKQLLGGTKGPIWYGSMALITRFATWALPQWYVDKACNEGRGLDLVRRH